MTHLMFDGYGVSSKIRLGDVNSLNQTVNLVLFELGLKPISPAFLLPYDYGLIPLDEGVSSFVFFPGGHFTIHTFPLRGCYFIDLFSQTEVPAKKFQSVIQKYWPSEPKISRLFSANRQGANESEPFSPEEVFGPHVMATVSLKKSLTIHSANQFLETLIHDINMTPITRAFGLYDQYDKPNYLSSLVMIAESHLSIHISEATQTLYFDIFSCKMFDYSGIQQQLSKLGKVLSWHVVPRGQKHDSRSSQRFNKIKLPTKTKKALNWWKE
jgi:S-adenosylmethionine/arginine decarboxylase-like enzyme